MKNFKLQKSDKALINSILMKIDYYRENHPLVAKLDFKTLYGVIAEEEKTLLEKIMKINPKYYGFKGPYYGLAPVPKNLVIVRNQRYRRKSKTKTLPPQLVPKNIYSAFHKLNQAMKNDISKILLIESGYRSPAYQLITFLYYLKFHKWNLRKTAKRVALPGYSEHGYLLKQALDFITIDGIPSDERPFEFAKTKEYRWLIKNAEKFNFHLSYPRNNKWGVMFEPWHWVFIGKSNLEKQGYFI